MFISTIYHIISQSEQRPTRNIICVLMCNLLLLLVCVSFTIIGQPRNSVLIRRV